MLVKQSKNQTNFVLPVKILTNKGYVTKNRYYDTEYQLYKAYRQLKYLNSQSIIALYPIIY